MKQIKRNDNRRFDELRKMKAKVGIVGRADGSAMFQIGGTIALASVFGPRELFPAFQQDSKKGVLKCVYDLMSFSVSERKRPGPSRRSVEISMVTENALLPVLDLTRYPNTVVNVFINILQADAGTRCAGICAASLALADAGIPMRDLVSAVSVGKLGKTLVLDIDKKEEDYPDGATDIPVAFVPRTGKLSLLQLDGEITRDELKEALKLAKKGCDEIYKLQIKTLKDKYKVK